MTTRIAPASVTRVIDGDTFIGDLHLWDYPAVVLAGTRFRLDGINCPEMSTDAGPEAKQFTTRWLVDENGDWLPITVTSRGLDNYGRMLAIVTRKGDMVSSLNEALLDSGNAVVMKMLVREDE